MTMLKVDCNQNGWTPVASGKTSMLLQLDTNGPIKVRLDSSAPDVDETSGIVMQRNAGGLGQIALHVIPSGQTIYIRGADSDTETVIVMTE